MTYYKINNLHTSSVLYDGDGETLREVVEKAIAAKCMLRGADLIGADLIGASLRGADLSGAYLSGASLRGASLRGADLSGASLRGASLRGADLSGASLRGADLSGVLIREKIKAAGQRPYLHIGPIGSRDDCLVAWITTSGVYVHAGCFFGVLEEFRVRVSSVHANTKHGREYMAAIALIEAHAREWSPPAATADCGQYDG